MMHHAVTLVVLSLALAAGQQKLYFPAEVAFSGYFYETTANIKVCLPNNQPVPTSVPAQYYYIAGLSDTNGNPVDPNNSGNSLHPAPDGTGSTGGAVGVVTGGAEWGKVASMTTDLDRLEKRLRSMPGCTEYAAAIVRLRVENQALEQQVAALRGVIIAISARAQQIVQIVETAKEAGNV